MKQLDNAIAEFTTESLKYPNMVTMSWFDMTRLVWLFIKYLNTYENPDGNNIKYRQITIKGSDNVEIGTFIFN